MFRRGGRSSSARLSAGFDQVGGVEPSRWRPPADRPRCIETSIAALGRRPPRGPPLSRPTANASVRIHTQFVNITRSDGVLLRRRLPRGPGSCRPRGPRYTGGDRRSVRRRAERASRPRRPWGAWFSSAFGRDIRSIDQDHDVFGLNRYLLKPVEGLGRRLEARYSPWTPRRRGLDRCSWRRLPGQPVVMLTVASASNAGPPVSLRPRRGQIACSGRGAGGQAARSTLRGSLRLGGGPLFEALAQNQARRGSTPTPGHGRKDGDDRRVDG
jgi:hypothetical protein